MTRSMHLKRRLRRRIACLCAAALLFVLLQNCMHDGADSVTVTTTTTTSSSTAVPLPVRKYIYSIDAIDNFDPLPTREGEPRVTFRAFVGCLAARLNVDLENRVELPWPTDEKTMSLSIPYMIVPVTLEGRDIKTLMCNITVRIRHLMYVQNEEIPEVMSLMEGLKVYFNFTNRLKIKQFATNIGFASSVNVGLRDALTYPFEDVPFIHISNNDIRFPSTLLTALIPDIYAAVRSDGARIDALTREMEEEATRAASEGYSILRTALKDAETSTLSTSLLLPDRIRYLPREWRRKEFSNHWGMFFFDHVAGPATLCLSRLAVLTAGFYDENYYPAYFEDPDIRWRVNMLGFKEHIPTLASPAIHFSDAVFVLTTDEPADVDAMEFEQRKDAWNGLRYPSVEGVRFSNAIRNSFTLGFGFHYAQLKWQVNSAVEFNGVNAVDEPYDTFDEKRRLPLDAYVIDYSRREAIRKQISQKNGSHERTLYSEQVIDKALKKALAKQPSSHTKECKRIC